MVGMTFASPGVLGVLKMKKILFINPSLRLHSSTKFLPVGVACVMTYLKETGIDFDLLDVDISDMEDDDIESFLEDNRYDIVLSGSIVTHYKWMKWLTKRSGTIIQLQNYYWKFCCWQHTRIVS